MYAQHRFPGDRVERGDAHLVDLALVGDAQLPFGLKLGGQSVGVPAEPALHLLAAHGLVAREQVLGVAGEKMPVVRKAVGERRAVVEDPLLASGAVVDGGLEGVVALPEREDAAPRSRGIGARETFPAYLLRSSVGSASLSRSSIIC